MEEKRKTQKGVVVLLVLLTLITVVSVILATWAWAKYTTSGTGTGTAQVAKWNVTVNDSSTFEQTYTHVLADRIAPGTSGSLDVDLNILAEVDTTYTVSISKVTVEYVDSTTSGTAKIPTNMTFKKAGTGTSATTTLSASDLKAGTVIASGTTTASSAATEKTIKALSWEWPYESSSTDATEQATYDAADTADGQNPVKITIEYKVVVTQQQPVAQ